MSLYLDGASLPSPTWMLVGATGRVCQDIGLHKALPSGARSRTDLECRNRLLWTAFVLDQNLALALGRPAVFRSEIIEVNLPGLLDNGGTGCDDEDPTTTISGWSGDDRALATFRANVNICRYIQDVTELKLTGGGQQDDVNKLLSIDDRLRSAWAEFPPQYTDPRSREPLEVPALRRKLLRFFNYRVYLLTVYSTLQLSACSIITIPLVLRFQHAVITHLPNILSLQFYHHKQVYSSPLDSMLVYS
jgi:hypothetical protein